MKLLSKAKADDIRNLVDANLSGYYSESSNSLNITKVASDLGFNVLEVYLDNGESGALLVDEKRGIKIIAVNKKDSINRKRFTIAHELGHYFLEKEYSKERKILIKHRDLKGECRNSIEEIEADYFAAYALIPLDKYQKFIKVNFGLDKIESDGVNSFKKMIATGFSVSENVAEAYMRSLLNG